MKKWMVLYEYCGKGYSAFFDNYNDALNFAINSECGIGAYWQIYQWDLEEVCYKVYQS